MTTRTAVTALMCAAAAFFLYLHGLGAVGVLSVDEPRYASIGHDMARTGDWVTPRLWGEPWFEKPALLYWMIALATTAGFRGEIAARLPVALASLAFLFFYFRCLSKEWGTLAAGMAVLMLSTSAGYLAYSRIAVTDLPLTATYSTAMLLAMPWALRGERRNLLAAGVFFGLAALAKGLVPMVLALPLLWWGRRRIPQLLPALAAGLAVALPWYLLCYARNGQTFLEVLFLQHQFARFSAGEHLHAQPWWWYAPVLAAGVFPWTPVLAAAVSRGVYRGPAARYFALWAGFGFLFFSASSGKLPGYLLPLLPALCALMGKAVSERPWSRWLLWASMVLAVAVFPPLVNLLPQAESEGLSRSTVAAAGHLRWLMAAAGLAAVFALAIWKLSRVREAAVAAAFVVASLIAVLLPRAAEELELRSTARPIWRSIERRAAGVCLEELDRKWVYGFNYYAGRRLPACADAGKAWRLAPDSTGRPVPRNIHNQNNGAQTQKQ